MSTEPKPLLPPPLIGHTDASLYADLDPEALSEAFVAYGRAYEGSWPRAVAATIRTYLKETNRPTYAAPSVKEIDQALAEAFERACKQSSENPS